MSEICTDHGRISGDSQNSPVVQKRCMISQPVICVVSGSQGPTAVLLHFLRNVFQGHHLSLAESFMSRVIYIGQFCPYIWDFY